MKNCVRKLIKTLFSIRKIASLSFFSLVLGSAVLAGVPRAGYAKSQGKPKGAGWMTISYSKEDSKYTVNGTGVNSTVKIPTVNTGGVFQITDQASLGAFVTGTLIGRSESITSNSGATINGTGVGAVASFVVNPNFFVYGSYALSESRSKVSRVSRPLGRSSGLSSYRGPSRSFSLGASVFVPIDKSNMSNFKLQYGNSQSRTNGYTLGGASDVDLTQTSVYPASKAYMQNLMLSARLTNSSHASFQPFVEWRATYVVAHSNNLKRLPFRMGNEVALGVDFPLDHLFSVGGEVDYGTSLLPGNKFGGSISLKYKF